MDAREWLSEVSSPSQWSEISPPSSPLSREFPRYQSEVVSLERITTPADATIAYLALRSLSAVQGRPSVPRAWERLFDRLLSVEPTRRQALASSIAEVVQQVFGLHLPEMPAEAAGIEEEGPRGTFHILNDLQFSIVGMLDIPSRCHFARTCRGNRALVQTWRTIEIEKIFSNEQLRRLFPFFFTHTAQIRHPESFDRWPFEWTSRIFPAILLQIKNSNILQVDERDSLLHCIGPDGVNDPNTLRILLQASYDISLVTAFEAIVSPWIDTRSYRSLPEKVFTAKNFFQLIDDSYVGFRIVPDAVTSYPYMTCEPEELFLGTSLSSMNFSNNGLLALPESLQFSSKLSRLVLHHNSLTVIPDSIGRLSQLTSIDLSCNGLTTLPESFGALKNLEELDLSGNPIIDLPDSFRALTKLQTLRMLHVNLNASFCHKLPPGVNVIIDAKKKFRPITMYRIFPRNVRIHYAEK